MVKSHESREDDLLGPVVALCVWTEHGYVVVDGRLAT